MLTTTMDGADGFELAVPQPGSGNIRAQKIIGGSNRSKKTAHNCALFAVSKQLPFDCLKRSNGLMCAEF